MIKLTIGETIMILRNRAKLSQQELGCLAFKNELKTPNVKIKKIEKGQQPPTKDDIKKITDQYLYSKFTKHPASLPNKIYILIHAEC